MISRLSKAIIAVVISAALTLVSVGIQAEVLWQDFSVTYLKGNNYRIGTPHQQVLTVEHVAETHWGDSFFFLDHMRESNDVRSNYAEWAPRLSLAKMSGKPFQYGLISDVLISTTVEMSELQTNFLYGVGVDLKLPGFQFMQLNGYRRVNDNAADNWQITTSWALPFGIGEQQFLYDGFFDWTTTNHEQRSSFNMASQLKWAVHPLLGINNPIFVGIEYVYWRNKYGIADSAFFRTHESNLNLLLKVHF